MPWLAGAAGFFLLVLVLWDGFETILLPRRVTRKLRLTSAFYRLSWRVWSGLFGRIRPRKRRDQALSAYGPLSMVMLLMLWAAGQVTAWALLHWARQSPMAEQAAFHTDLPTYLYVSGTTFFTLGLGDIVPRDTVGRVLTVIEAGSGFGFLAIVIGYMPVLYGAFSQRERAISLLDARAGTPPSAVELLCRYHRAQGAGSLDALLVEWERWAADLLQSLVSYPVLAFYRSQHDNQSWLATLATMLDACALLLAGAGAGSRWQAQLTFAMARHAVVDLAQVLHAPPYLGPCARLSPADLPALVRVLHDAAIPLPPREEFEARLAELRRMYEPYVEALGRRLRLPGAVWLRRGDPADNWQTSAWERRVAGILEITGDDHE
jgi:hypothetical protein